MGKDRILMIQILIADIILMSVTICATYWTVIKFEPETIFGFQNILKLLCLYNICLLACNAFFPPVIQYRIIKIESIIERTIIISTFLFLFLSVCISFIESGMKFPRRFTVITVGIFTILSIIERIVIRNYLNSTRREKRNLTPIVLVGKDQSILDIFKVLRTPHYGYEVKGVFYDGDAEIQELSSIHIGEVNDLIPYLEKHNEIKEIYGNFPYEKQKMTSMVSRFCDNNLMRFFYVPSLEIFHTNVIIRTLDGVPVIARREEPLTSPTNKLIKRAFDFTISSLFLLLVFPWLFIIVGLMIKIQSPGPIFFKQKRTGLDGKVFTCYKFRTMKVNDQSDTLQATEDDPRKYPFGNFMRKTNLDEFPQFINVFLGDMSIVGPRPHMLKHTDEYSQIINKYMVRHLAKPGITGLAQISGFRGETKYIEQMEGRVKFDIEYIENWTFLLDIKIIFKTITNMIGGEENAY